MKSFGRILLLIAATGVLQTALAATDLTASRACLAAAAGLTDGTTDCAPARLADGPARVQAGAGALPKDPPRPKDLPARAAAWPLPDRTDGQRLDTTTDARLPPTPVFLITRRLRI